MIYTVHIFNTRGVDVEGGFVYFPSLLKLTTPPKSIKYHDAHHTPLEVANFGTLPERKEKYKKLHQHYIATNSIPASHKTHHHQVVSFVTTISPNKGVWLLFVKFVTHQYTLRF